MRSESTGGGGATGGSNSRGEVSVDTPIIVNSPVYDAGLERCLGRGDVIVTLVVSDSDYPRWPAMALSSVQWTAHEFQVTDWSKTGGLFSSDYWQGDWQQSPVSLGAMGRRGHKVLSQTLKQHSLYGTKVHNVYDDFAIGAVVQCSHAEGMQKWPKRHWTCCLTV